MNLGLHLGNFLLETGDLLRVVRLIARSGQQLAQFLHPRLGGVELLLLLLVHECPLKKLGVAMLKKGG